MVSSLQDSLLAQDSKVRRRMFALPPHFLYTHKQNEHSGKRKEKEATPSHSLLSWRSRQELEEPLNCHFTSTFFTLPIKQSRAAPQPLIDPFESGDAHLGRLPMIWKLHKLLHSPFSMSLITSSQLSHDTRTQNCKEMRA